MKKTLVILTLLAVTAAAALAPPTASAARGLPCTSLVMSCPALFCQSYDPVTGRASGCMGEPVQCVTEPCPYGLP